MFVDTARIVTTVSGGVGNWLGVYRGIWPSVADVSTWPDELSGMPVGARVAVIVMFPGGSGKGAVGLTTPNGQATERFSSSVGFALAISIWNVFVVDVSTRF